MNMKRRTFLKSTLAGSTVAIAVSAGLLTPSTVLAAWNKSAFEARGMEAALSAAGLSGAMVSKEIKIKAPDIAENGSVVPVTISTSLKAESIAIFSEKNPTPLASTYALAAGTHGFVSTRLKMSTTGNIIAVVKAGGKLYKTHKEVKVTIGGCGG
jgi:sulfur-oxidizing protein SoxY